MPLLYGLVVLCLLMASAAGHTSAGSSPYLLKDFVINSTGLSVTSLRYNPSPFLPRWVDHLLGTKAVFWRMNQEGDQKNISTTLASGREAVAKAIRINPSAFSPQCSFEVLGFVRLGQHPFIASNKHRVPVLGYGSLDLGGRAWDCYYRATYDNWRASEVLSEGPHFWPLFLYCPAPRTPQGVETHCMQFATKMEGVKEMAISLTVQAQGVQWVSRLTLVPNAGHGKAHSEAAICTSMPYISSEEAKRDVVGAIFFEWLKYHSNLGLRIVVFDATGKQAKYLSQAPYSRRHQTVSNLLTMRSNVEYHPFSVLSRLDPSMLSLQYDNDFFDVPVISKLDDDHTYSLTHCRFQTEAQYGIDNILIVDFDEFLFCPAAGLTAKGQSQFLHRYIRSARHHGLDQLLLFQEVLYNRTAEGARECMLKQLGSAGSVFDCFAAYKHQHTAVLHKSLHLTNVCPFATDHHACTNIDGMDMHDYDCMCFTYMATQCAVVHLAMKESEQVSHGQEVDAQVRASKLELSEISNSESVTWRQTGKLVDL